MSQPNGTSRLSRAMVVRALAAIAIAAALTACGGGGGGGGGAPQPSSPPAPPTPPPAGTFALDTSSLTFTAGSVNSLPASQVVNATVTGVTSATALFFVVEVTGPAVANVTNIQITGPTTGAATVVPAPASQLGLGTHSSTITVRACTSGPTCATDQLAGSPATVNVTYHVNGITVSPESLSYTIGNSPSIDDRTRTLTVSGHPSPTWAATGNDPWLTRTPTSGDTVATNTLDVVVDEVFLQGFKNGTHQGTVTLTPSVGDPLIVPVTLTLQRTQVDFVAPYIAVSGTQDEVIIRGAEFDAGDITGVKFGGAPAVAYDVVSATEIRATHPALAAGKYAVTLEGNADAASAVSLATLVVVDPMAYQAQRLVPFDDGLGPEEPTGIVYDAERGSVYVAFDRPEGDFVDGLRRFSYTGAAWADAVDVIVNHDDLYSATLTTDGTALLLATKNQASQSELHLLSLESSTALELSYPLSGAADYIRSVAATNDGRAVLVSATEPVTGTRPLYLGRVRELVGGPSPPPLEQLLATGNADPNLVFDGTAGASLDGSRVLIASSAQAPNAHLLEYDASSGVLSDTGLTLQASSIELDRTGTRILRSDRYVYDVDLQLIGELPADTLAAALSPDGSTVYTYDSAEQVNSFDVSGDSLVAINSWAANGSAGASDRRVVMTVSPDGQTLFIAGSEALLVEPVQ